MVNVQTKVAKPPLFYGIIVFVFKESMSCLWRTIMYDIAIVGGGPAGSTLARFLGRKYRILLLERRTFREPIYSASQKCCGGLIAPDAQKMLASFGLGIPKSVILSPQLFAVRTIDLNNALERYYQRYYINIDREEFDKWLESIIPSEVNVINGCVYKSHQEREDHVLLKYAVDGKEYEEKAGILVGADGAFSKVRRSSFSGQPCPKQYISIQEWFETGDNLNYYGAIFDDEITDFYSWTIPKEDYLILGTALTPDHNAYGKFELLKTKLKKYGYDFSRSVRKNGAFLLRPERKSQICTGRGRIALVGEAAGFISPSSAEGLSYAFKSSLALARAIKDGFEHWYELYNKNTVSLKRNITLKNLKSPVMYNGFLRNIAMRSGLMSISLESVEY